MSILSPERSHRKDTIISDEWFEDDEFYDYIGVKVNIGSEE
jgi:hypothetical protein